MTLQQAAAYANEMAYAFRTAGNKSVVTQDLLTFLMVGAAASAVVGAADEVSAGIISRRASGGAAVGFLQRRGLSRADIDALYLGALQANCIARTASLSLSVNPDTKMALLTIFYIREVELRVRFSLVDEVVEFEDVLKVFQEAGNAVILRSGTSATLNQSTLEEYQDALDQCMQIEAPEREEDTNGKTPQTPTDDAGNADTGGEDDEAGADGN